MGKLTDKGKRKGKKSSTYKYDIKTSNHEESTNAEYIGNAFEIKRPAT